MIYLMRHGETDWNVEKRMQGQVNIPLNNTGKEQAKNAAEQVAKLKIEHIFCSDLARAKETAEIINQTVGVEIVADKRLRELGFGDFEGKYRNSISEDEWKKFKETPKKYNGETLEELYNRIKSFFDDIAIKKLNNILIVSHGITISMMKFFGENKECFNLDKYKSKYSWENYKTYHTVLIEL